MHTYTAIIIGSGFGGMTAALKLKRLSSMRGRVHFFADVVL